MALNLTGLGNFTSTPEPELILKNGKQGLSSTGKQLNAIYEIDIEKIVEDSEQPRTIFNQNSLQELANDIANNGLLQAISVRPNPDQPEQYIVNFGARRLRACKLAGLQKISAFIQEESTKYQQMAENIHRDNLKPLEIASFIEAEVQLGKKKIDIAKALGKSPAYVSQFVNLSNSPDWIKLLSASGVCSDVTTLNELAKLAESGEIEDLENKISEYTTFNRSDLIRFSEKDKIESIVENEVLHEVTPEAILGTKDELKTKISKEPDYEHVIYIGSRKGYIQNKNIKVYFEDVDNFENIPLLDVLDAN